MKKFQWDFKSEKIKLSDDLFQAFNEFIYSHTGIRFHVDMKFVLERRLIHRMQELQLPNLEQYYYYLLYHPAREEEIDHLIDAITTNETYFFREKRQLKCFQEEIIPLLIERKRKERQKSIRIWSAGCSTGEEPYTIAMILNEFGAMRREGWKLFIFASDISSRVLSVARTGIYSGASFRDIEPYYLKKYFVQINENQYKISDEIKRMVLFGKVNILDTTRLVMYGVLDIIFCRNVLIYFDMQSKKKAVDNFYHHLVDGGYLLLGHSESLLGIDSRFKLVHFKHDMVYQK